MRAYSSDLRERVVAAVDRGMPKAEAAEAFGVSARSVDRYLELRRETDSLAPRPIPGRPSVKGAALAQGLLGRLEGTPAGGYPDATIPEPCELWASAGGIAVGEATMSRALEKLGWTRKKRR